MTAGVRRRVRVVIEGEAHEVSDRCEVLRIDLPRDVNMLVPTVMVNPSWEGVTVEDVAPSYNWQDGDAVVVTATNLVWARDGGYWFAAGSPSRVSDGGVTRLIGAGEGDVLRYQAGDA